MGGNKSSLADVTTMLWYGICAEKEKYTTYNHESYSHTQTHKLELTYLFSLPYVLVHQGVSKPILDFPPLLQ